MATQKDRIYTTFMLIKKNILTHNDAKAFKVLQNIVKSEVKKAKE